MYEYEELDPYVKTKWGYSPLELAVEVGKDRVLEWIINQKVIHNKQYPGLELDEYDKIKLLHHAVNNPDNNSNTLKKLLDYTAENYPGLIEEGFLSVFHRALLRKCINNVKVLKDFHKENEMQSQVILTILNHLNR